MYQNTSQIVSKANELVRIHGTRDPYELCDALGISILPQPFEVQKGAYFVLMRNAFITIKNDLEPTMEYIVLYHELGHHILHRRIAETCGAFHEFNLFDMQNNRMEYEANVFASQLSLEDRQFLDYIEQGYDIQQIAQAMDSDINLVALKVDTLISQGYRLRRQDHKSRFLSGNRNQQPYQQDSLW